MMRTKTSNRERLDSINKILNPLLEKLQGVTEINSLREKIEEQNKYITKIKNLEREQEELKKRIATRKDNILQLYSELFDLKKQIKDYFNSKSYFENINVTTYVDFDNESFNETFMSQFKRRGRLSKLFPNHEEHVVFDDDEEFIFNTEGLLTIFNFSLRKY
ncbi:hypothetical protein [Thalassobacillus sp. C254]|uniref:coiled-coil domain-containing protein n=1 Tax=Thalassobacillus sp. C254 TaxID=1225341 RepID=UPI0006CF3273|nr:hypothetical protein [Thalassobacillus sp. C254]